ncbi:MAG TPA: amino acid racemase [Planctomycetota bacterium]|nr:amino acid racemase [Planctomycetota bacterium]HRR78921.1 amino acid racemase [Planctomycetota bacterium]HRT92801.1 amino acid racemase [Planctomycetota bacterium]
MAKHIGIVACSAEGAALCYRTICAEASARMGEHAHPETTMHTHPLAAYMVHIRSGEWAAVAELMLSSAHKLAAVGADFAICPDNTIHQAFGLVEPRSPIPWLHIARIVAFEAKRRGFARLGILGTRYLMEGPVYPEALAPAGIAALVPDEADRERIDAIIFRELVNAVFTEESRLYLNAVMARLRARGADAAVLGCTEIPLLVRPDEAPLPTLDSTRLLARAALACAIGA